VVHRKNDREVKLVRRQNEKWTQLKSLVSCKVRAESLQGLKKGSGRKLACDTCMQGSIGKKGINGGPRIQNNQFLKT
jgi:hypothetical protein